LDALTHAQKEGERCAKHTASSTYFIGSGGLKISAMTHRAGYMKIVEHYRNIIQTVHNTKAKPSIV